MLLGTFLGQIVRARGDFAVVDDQALLQTLIARCRDLDVNLAECCSLLNLSWSHGRIQVRTTAGSYNVRLVVDASGGLSPIAKTFRLHRIDGFYAVCGAHVKGIKLHSVDVVLAHVGHLGDPPPALEVVPTSETSAFCAVFTYSLPKAQSLEAMFQNYCQHNDFFSWTAGTRVVTAKAGAIPIGSLRRRHLPGVALIGEAALIQPPLLGTAFNEILEYADPIASHLSSALAQSTGVPKRPTYRFPSLKRIQDRLQLEMTRVLLRGNMEAFERLTRFANSLPEPTLYKLCSNELNWLDVMDAAVRLPARLFLARMRPIGRG